MTLPIAAAAKINTDYLFSRNKAAYIARSTHSKWIGHTKQPGLKKKSKQQSTVSQHLCYELLLAEFNGRTPGLTPNRKAHRRATRMQQKYFTCSCKWRKECCQDSSQPSALAGTEKWKKKKGRGERTTKNAESIVFTSIETSRDPFSCSLVFIWLFFLLCPSNNP